MARGESMSYRILVVEDEDEIADLDLQTEFSIVGGEPVTGRRRAAILPAVATGHSS